MQVNFNPTISNNKQSVNFGAVNQKWLKEIKSNPYNAMRYTGDVEYAFSSNKQTLEDLRDTFSEGLEKYVRPTGKNGTIQMYQEFIDATNKKLGKFFSK